jgi:hypothetical protein
MEQIKNIRRFLYQLGAQRWGKEILLAVVLTIAAVAFIAAAVVGRGGSDEAKNHYETAVKPLPQ